MKKSTTTWNTAGLTLPSVSDAWSVAQAQLVEVLRWSAAPRVQARYWVTAVNCSARECAKRMLSVLERK